MATKRRDWDGAGVCRACGASVTSISLAACPDCGGVVLPAAVSRRRPMIGWLSVPPMLYQQSYVWFVFVSALDVMLTWIILLLGGSEVNVVADAVIAHAGIAGIVGYKFCLVIFVVLMCEVVGRRRPRIGRKLAEWSVAITAIPVVLSFVQLFVTR